MSSQMIDTVFYATFSAALGLMFLVWWKTRSFRAGFQAWLIRRYGGITAGIVLMVYAISPLLAGVGYVQPGRGWSVFIGSLAFVVFSGGYVYELILYYRTEYRQTKPRVLRANKQDGRQ
jgi:hypothetical protein